MQKQTGSWFTPEYKLSVVEWCYNNDKDILQTANKPKIDRKQVFSNAQKVLTRYRNNGAPKLIILSVLKLPSRGLVVFMNTYIRTEDRNFKTFLKQVYSILLDSCYIFTKKKDLTWN